MASRRDYAARFWSFVANCGAALDACWLWTGARNRDGYGAFNAGAAQHNARAHRVAWELTNGPVPRGLNVLHQCDNPACCNPAHLFLGTQRDNMHDRLVKGRWAGGRKSRLPPHARAAVLAAFNGGEGTTSLARRFGVSKGSIQHIVGQGKDGHRHG